MASGWFARGADRDLLLNLRRTTPPCIGHIVEVQITLAPLLKVKQSGGHEAYGLAVT